MNHNSFIFIKYPISIQLAIVPFYSLFEQDPSKAHFFNLASHLLLHLFSYIRFTEEIFACRVPPFACGWLQPYDMSLCPVYFLHIGSLIQRPQDFQD